MNVARTLWNDEAGLVLSAELVLILTIAVLAMVVGLNAVASSVNQELNDLAGAFGTVDQSYAYTGFLNPRGFNSGFCGAHAFVRGSAYADAADVCDCSEVVAIAPTVKADGGTGASESGAARGAAGAGAAAGGRPAAGILGSGGRSGRGGKSSDLRVDPRPAASGAGRKATPCETGDCE